MKFVLFFFALFISCSSQPEPMRILDQGGLNIPVYDEQSLDYFLHLDNNEIHVVNFWATWCAPCVKELPYFERINEEMSDEGVNVHLISLDFENQLESTFVPFVRKKVKSDVSVILPNSEQKMIELVDDEWSGALPATIIYSKDKREFISGEINYEELKTAIKSFN